ncbi:Glutathione peroxidase [Paragonimus heterotremus]|uniref:Glutathione peroxidase n=1 Tax=Paragonimus heterotremus TaxID=100268 RepID=A0A8J4T4G3_9TREM|nr:Glutathione peroxidase [Paragonimus heterotremus]
MNYRQLQALYIQHAADGLCILAFPSNQFLNLEPGTDEEIKQYVTDKYNVTFQLFHKIDVNGNNTIPLYRYLKEKLPGYQPKGDIEYNYVKFLIDRNGVPRERFPSSTPPMKMHNSIQRMLNQ